MRNTLYTGDNLCILNGMNSESVDLIYLDPPFNSKRMYSAPIGSQSAGARFKDMWSWHDIDEHYLEKLVVDYPYLVEFIQSIRGIHSKPMMSYITYMTQRIIELHRVLKSTGSLYIHIDPTASHYLKVALDNVFGQDQFRNEMIWYYKNASRGKKQFAKAHDTILFYTKNKKYTFNLDDIVVPFESSMTEWRYTKGNQKGKSKPKGKTPDDVITMPSLNAMSKERTGYPTQKPLKLLDHIIRASSNENDVVLDPFCGCATTCVSAQQLKRKWIGIDIEDKAVQVLIDRLSNDAGMFKDFIHRTDIPKRSDKQEEPPSLSIKERLYQEQKGLCCGCAKCFDNVNLEIDHIIPKSKGGGDYYDNYQLLCGNCNRIKGDRPMEYLRMKIQKRQELIKHNVTFGE